MFGMVGVELPVSYGVWNPAMYFTVYRYETWLPYAWEVSPEPRWRSTDSDVSCRHQGTFLLANLSNRSQFHRISKGWLALLCCCCCLRGPSLEAQHTQIDEGRILLKNCSLWLRRLKTLVFSTRINQGRTLSWLIMPMNLSSRVYSPFNFFSSSQQSKNNYLLHLLRQNQNLRVIHLKKQGMSDL